MNAGFLDQIEFDLIVKIFRNEISERPLAAKRFRIANSDHLDILDRLESNNYVTNPEDLYHLKIESLSLISEAEQTAGQYINQMKPMFNMLRSSYCNDPESNLLLTQVEHELEYSRSEILRFVEFLSDLPIWRGRSNTQDFDGAFLCPSETILKYPFLEDAIAAVKSWRKPPATDKSLLKYISSPKLGNFDFLLHPKIIEASLNQYHDGYLRDAVLNSIMILFDTIRLKTGLKQDGEKLINEAFSVESPYLIFSHLDTDTGMNDQKGFMQMLRGAYQGIRNTTAHTLDNEFTNHTAAQYLVFASLLMHRIEKATVVKRN